MINADSPGPRSDRDASTASPLTRTAARATARPSARTTARATARPTARATALRRASSGGVALALGLLALFANAPPSCRNRSPCHRRGPRQ